MNEDFNRVFFDGNELSYIVNGVQIINGEFPTEYELKGDYVINAEDLSLITALISEKKASYTRNWGWGALTSVYICDEDNLIKKMKQHLEDYKEHMNMSQKECKKITNIKNKIDIFNKLPWYKRIFKKVELNEK